MGAGEISLNLRITSGGGVPLVVQAPQVHFKPQACRSRLTIARKPQDSSAKAGVAFGAPINISLFLRIIMPGYAFAC
jgi:hypothetical protein